MFISCFSVSLGYHTLSKVQKKLQRAMTNSNKVSPRSLRRAVKRFLGGERVGERVKKRLVFGEVLKKQLETSVITLSGNRNRRLEK